MIPMLMNQFFTEVNNLTNKIQEEQSESILKASQLIVDSLEKGGAVHIFDTGHLINSELIGRAGGLLLMKALNYSFHVDNHVRQRDQGDKNTSQEGLAEYVLRSSKVLPGDVLIIGSVSGKTIRPVDLALEAKRLGVHVIALTSLTYSSSLESDHSCGKKLYEFADVTLDNCAPVGDAMVPVEGLDVAICPASGIAAACIMWALTADIVEKLLAKGITPSVYKSINHPAGAAHNEALYQKYRDTGY